MIYKLCCNDPNITDCYVGSTTNFKCRKNSHKTVCNNENSKKHNLNVYKFIREHGGFENWSMILIENFPCDTKLELHKRERYWLETLGAMLNKQVPSRNKKESDKNYRDNNKEKIKEKQKDWYERNKEQILLKSNEKIICACGTISLKCNLIRHFKSKKHQKFISS